jgi:hypothetical protein
MASFGLQKGGDMPTPWKELERRAAKALGGTRNLRGSDFSKPGADVEHKLFSIEAKYRARLPVLLRDGLAQAKRYDGKKVPLLLIKSRGQRGAYAVLHLSDLVDLLGPVEPVGD